MKFSLFYMWICGLMSIIAVNAHVLNEGLHYPVLVRHVCHHMCHVVLCGAHQRGTKHDGKVSWFHLTYNKTILIKLNFSHQNIISKCIKLYIYLILVWVVSHSFEMSWEELEGLVMMIRQLMKLVKETEKWCNKQRKINKHKTMLHSMRTLTMKTS